MYCHNFEWGFCCCCCCCEDIQIAPLVHQASSHSLNAWTQPPPGVVVPASACCGWRVAWVVTLPVVSRRSRWPPLPPRTTVCVLWHYGLCLFNIAALCSCLFVAKTKDIVSATTKRSSFSRALEPVFHRHLSLAWWRLWLLEKVGWTRVSSGWAVKCWYTQRSFHIRMQSAQGGLFYSSKTL